MISCGAVEKWIPAFAGMTAIFAVLQVFWDGPTPSDPVMNLANHKVYLKDAKERFNLPFESGRLASLLKHGFVRSG